MSPVRQGQRGLLAEAIPTMLVGLKPPCCATGWAMPACPWGWSQLTTVSSRGVTAQSNAPSSTAVLSHTSSTSVLDNTLPEPGWSPPMKVEGISCLGVSFQCGSDALVMLACTRAGPQFVCCHWCHIYTHPHSSVKQGHLSQPHTGTEQSPRGTVLSDKPLSDVELPLKGFFNAPPPPFSLFSTAGTTGHSREIFTHH